MRTLVIPQHIPQYLAQPLSFLRSYDLDNLRQDLIAGITVAVILLPQAIAFALIAELPPEMGIYAAVIGAFIGALWGSSNQIHTGPTNAISLLVLSSLTSAIALSDQEVATSTIVIMAGMMAVMVGVFQLILGLARLGMLVNFVSHSVIVGFASGAGVLIAIRQVRHLFGLEFESHNLFEILQGIVLNFLEMHPSTAAIGVGTILLIVAFRKFVPRLPASLVTMVIASTIVGLFGLDEKGVAVIGQLPRNLPPLADLPLFDLDLIAQLSTGALAVAAIGLVETAAISRSIATWTGQRLESNQEFVGQGLANIFVGFFSGYPVAGSFSRSAVNFKAGARTKMAALMSGILVLIALFTLGPLASFLPRAALAGVLIVTAYGMINMKEIGRIWSGARHDAIIMLVTFLGTLFLHIEFAVLLGILFSFAFYIKNTSTCQVSAVLPDEKFKHFLPQSNKNPCPQLGIINISGDIYFGAVTHIEEAILEHLDNNPEQRFLMMRMHQVNQCDFSGIHMLESVLRSCKERQGDIFFVRVNPPVMALMKSTGFYDHVGADHFLDEDEAIWYLFHKVLDPAICIYECPVRAFKECQNLPKQKFALEIPVYVPTFENGAKRVKAESLWHEIRGSNGEQLVLDVREPSEFKRGHIPKAKSAPLSALLDDCSILPNDCEIVLVCRAGRRSQKAAELLKQNGFDDISILQGGMLAWESSGLLQAVDR